MYKAYRVEQHNVNVGGVRLCLEERWYIKEEGYYTTNIEAAAIMDSIPKGHYGVPLQKITT